MALPRPAFVTAVVRHAARLRFRQLFFLTAALFLLDVVVPDLLPFADEILLGLLTLLFGMWRKQEQDTMAPR